MGGGIAVLPTGHGVIEIRDSITHQSREVLPSDGERCLGYGEGVGTGVAAKAVAFSAAVAVKGYRSTPTNDGTGSVDLDDVTIAGGVV